MKKSMPAFSLVEMLMTIGILAIVLLIASQTLNTVFRVSTISQLKSITRNEVGFSIELLERLLANSNVVDVYLYDSVAARTYDEESGLIVDDDAALTGVYNNQILSGDSGTELHIRPYGYNIWVCIGYFEAPEESEYVGRGYLLKRTLPNLTDHQSCFDTTSIPLDTYPILSLTSDDVKVNHFGVSYIRNTNLNNVFYVDITMEPTSWVPGKRSNLERTVVRQAVVTTQGLTWY